MSCRVAMLVANEVVHDGRVRKTARTVAAAGYDVTVVGIANKGYGVSRSTIDGFGLWRVHSEAQRRLDALAGDRAALDQARKNVHVAKAGLNPGFPGRVRDRLVRGSRKRRYEAYQRAKDERAAARAAVLERKSAHAGLARFSCTWSAALEELQPDVVHVHDHQPLLDGLAYVEARAQQGKWARLVYDAHEYHMGRAARKGRTSNLNLEVEQRVAPRADAVITVSEPIADLLHAGLGLRERPLVIANLPALRAAKTSTRRLRGDLGMPEDVPLVVYSGGIKEHRGVDLLVRAVARLPGVHLAFVTMHDRRVEPLVDLARSLGAEKRVHFAPAVPVEEVSSYLAGADLGGYTPRADGINHVALPNKLFEYLHAGLPLVVGDLGEIGRFVRETGVGEVHPPADDVACADAIMRVLANRESYVRRREDLIAAWSWEAQEARLLALYDRFCRPVELTGS